MSCMLRYFTDENFNNDITRGLRLRAAHLDIVRIQETDVAGAADAVVLGWAATVALIVLTHDKATMPGFAFARVAAGDSMPGLFVVNDRMPVHEAIEELFYHSRWNRPGARSSLGV